VLFLVILLSILAWYEPTALTTNQFRYVVINASLALALASAGLTLVVIVGGLDLSSAGVIALSNALLATQLGGGTAQQIVTILAVILIGGLAGFLNGIVVTRFDLESVVVTLATGFILGGLARLLLPVPLGLERDATSVISWFTASIMGIPVGVIVFLAVAMLWVGIRRLHFGTSLLAIGSDAEAAADAGINVSRTKVMAFTGAGLLYALAGVALTSQTSGGDPSVGASYLLGAFAVVVIGGIRLGGGRGSLIGALLGAISLTIAIDVLFVIGVASYWNFVARGALLLIAVGMQAIAVIAARWWSSAPPPIETISADAGSRA
jgi:ribose transport system permease protein